MIQLMNIRCKEEFNLFHLRNNKLIFKIKNSHFHQNKKKKMVRLRLIIHVFGSINIVALFKKCIVFMHSLRPYFFSYTIL